MDTQTPAGGTPQDIDPSTLTTQFVWREVASLKEFILSHISRIDKSIDLAHEDLVRYPTEAYRAVENLKNLHEEKINAIKMAITDDYRICNERFLSTDKQMEERDKRMDLVSVNAKENINIALQSAEKAVNKQNETFAQSMAKSEASTVKQIDLQAAVIATMAKAIEDKIGDIKDRITTIEGQSLGKADSRGHNKDVWGYVVGGIGLLITIITIVLTVMRNYNS